MLNISVWLFLVFQYILVFVLIRFNSWRACGAENRGDGVTTGGDLSPPDIKFVPPPASTTKASPGSNFRRPPSSASRGSASSSPSAGRLTST